MKHNGLSRGGWSNRLCNSLLQRGSDCQIVACHESILIVGNLKRTEFPRDDALHAEFGSFSESALTQV